MGGVDRERPSHASPLRLDAVSSLGIPLLTQFQARTMNHRSRLFDTPPNERLAPYFRNLAPSWGILGNPGPTTKAAWIQRRAELRPRILRALSLDPLPERIPLAVTEEPGADVADLSFSRIAWQILPKAYARGWLVMPPPSGEEEARPPTAVILSYGAGMDERSTALAWMVGLARQGYAVLAPDPARFSYPEAGISPLTLGTWSMLRAFELLHAHPSVDGDRVGVVATAGGAQQALYLLAIDDKERIRATSLPAVLPGLAEASVAWQPVPGLIQWTGSPEILGLASPRAVELRGDGVAEGVVADLRALYRIWGQEDRLAIGDGTSDPSVERAATYQWLERELRGNRSAAELASPIPDAEMPTLPEIGASDDQAGQDEAAILEWVQKRLLVQPPPLESKGSRRAWQERLRTDLSELLGLGVPLTALAPALAEAGGDQAEGPRLLTLTSEPEVDIACAWLPAGASAVDAENEQRTKAAVALRPAVLALHPDGKEAALVLPWVQGLKQAGWSVLAPDVRFRGEMAADPSSTMQAAMEAAGRPEVGMATTDALAALRWLFGQADVDPGRVVIIGVDDQGVTALLAGGFDERVAGVVADCSDTTYRDGGEGLPEVPGILRYADVPQIASLVAPRLLWLYRVPEERVGFASRRYYDWTRRMHQALGEDESLKMSTGAGPDPAGLAEWLERRLKKLKR